MLIQIDNELVKECKKHVKKMYGGEITNLKEYSQAVESVIKEFFNIRDIINETNHNEDIQEDILNGDYEYTGGIRRAI